MFISCKVLHFKREKMIKHVISSQKTLLRTESNDLLHTQIQELESVLEYFSLT